MAIAETDSFDIANELRSDTRKDEWPWNCCYFDPLTHDGERISYLLEEATTSSQRPLPLATYSFVRNGRVRTVEQSMKDSPGEAALFSQDVLASQLLVIHVPLYRHTDINDRYQVNPFYSDTGIEVSDKSSWKALLQYFDILPNLLELLHSTAGGTFSHTTYLPRGEQTSSAPSYLGTTVRRTPSAWHVAYDSGERLFPDKLIYARVDLLTERSLVLVLGEDMEDPIQDRRIFESTYLRVHRLLLAQPDAHAFHVIAALQRLSGREIENACGFLEWHTEMREEETGTRGSHKPGRRLRAEELSFNALLYSHASRLREELRITSRVLKIQEAFKTHMATYQTLCCDRGAGHDLDDSTMKNLFEDAEMTSSLIEDLHASLEDMLCRTLAQVDVQRSIMAERDTQINIDIARAAVRDSKLVRGIAVVTMIFLPGTFVATFFSMVFFSVGEDGRSSLKVDRSVWLHPAITVPMTLGVMATYALWSWLSFKRTADPAAKKTSPSRDQRKPPSHRQPITKEEARPAPSEQISNTNKGFRRKTKLSSSNFV